MAQRIRSEKQTRVQLDIQPGAVWRCLEMEPKLARACRSTAFTMPMIGVAFGVPARTVGRAVATWEAVRKLAGTTAGLDGA